MIARIRLVVEVPYHFDLDEPDETGSVPNGPEAARQADELVMAQAKEMLGSLGTVVEELCLIEEVRSE